MINNLKVLILLLFVSCNKYQKTYHLDEIDFDINELNQYYKSNIDFNLRDSIFVSNIEKRYNQDLCKNPNIDLMLDFKKTSIVIPIQIIKSCPFLFHSSRNSIYYLINKNDQVLIEDDFHFDRETTSLKLAEIIDKYRSEYKKRHIVLNFNWAKNSDDKKVKKRFKELINGILIYRKKLAKELFDTNIKNCIKSQKDSLNSHTIFTIQISTYNFSKPPPPPPPLSIGLMEP